jgi:hypothetical protein
MKEINIHVTKTGWDGLDGTWVVIFTTDVTRISNKEVTFCAIRKNDGFFFTPSAGCSVKNPLDEDDPQRGEREAFKRAVESTTAYPYYDKDRKYIVDRFRGALWIAMGRPGYKKEELHLVKGTPFVYVEE